MCRSLPSQANLEQIRKEARNFLHDLLRQDPSAIRRLYSLDALAGTFEARLADAQYVIAREYGCKSWPELKKRVNAANPNIPGHAPFALASSGD